LQIFLKNQAQKVIENFRKKEKSRKKFWTKLYVRAKLE
jgi:hypothetical protein